VLFWSDQGCRLAQHHTTCNCTTVLSQAMASIRLGRQGVGQFGTTRGWTAWYDRVSARLVRQVLVRVAKSTKLATTLGIMTTSCLGRHDDLLFGSPILFKGFPRELSHGVD
jgi:hypothetical protein